MNFSFYIAKRYLLAKKFHNITNIISMITVLGMVIAVFAAVCILSVFNGFHNLIFKTFSSFDPELKITSVKDKVFDPTSSIFLKIRKLSGVAVVSEILEDNVLIKYQQQQFPVIIKGVSNNFNKLIPIENIIFNGKFELTDGIHSFAVLGIGVARNLKIDPDFIFSLSFYVPKRKNQDYRITIFNEKHACISGIFMLNQPMYDDNYVIVPINFARQLLGYKVEISALEIKLRNHACISSIKKKMQKILKNDFSVKDRYEQQQLAFNMICIEKWVTFLLLCFIFSIVVFNLSGALTILVINKRRDINTFIALGADKRLITRIFFWVGWGIAIFGCFIGIFFGIFVCFLQSRFGWIHLGNDVQFLINTYPVQIEISDLVLIFFTVIIISFLLVFYFTKNGMNKYF